MFPALHKSHLAIAIALVTCIQLGSRPLSAIAEPIDSATSVSTYVINLPKTLKQPLHVTAVLLSPGDAFVMSQGLQSDDYAKYVRHFSASDADGRPLTVSYDSAVPQWTIESAKAPIRISYDVDLAYLTALPQFARLQEGFTQSGTTYLTDNVFVIFPKADVPATPIQLQIDPPANELLAAPWPETVSSHMYRTTLFSVTHNTIDYGMLAATTIQYRGFPVQFVMVGSIADARDDMRRVFSQVLPRYMALFPNTIGSKYLVTVTPDWDDAQAFDSSMSVAIGAPALPAFRMLWANSLAHELFHYWNGERIRPSDRKLNTITEGFTEYYANLTLERTGLITPETYWEIVGRHLGAYTYFMFSPNYGMPLIDAAKNKTRNRFGVYDGGWTLAMCLDLEIRHATHERRSLDDVMRLLWERFGRKRISFGYADLVQAVSDVAGRSYTNYFASYFLDPNILPFETDLSFIGVEVESQAFAGITYVVPLGATGNAAFERSQFLHG